MEFREKPHADKYNGINCCNRIVVCTISNNVYGDKFHFKYTISFARSKKCSKNLCRAVNSSLLQQTLYVCPLTFEKFQTHPYCTSRVKHTQVYQWYVLILFLKNGYSLLKSKGGGVELSDIYVKHTHIISKMWLQKCKSHMQIHCSVHLTCLEYLDQRRMTWQDTGENCTIRSAIICTLQEILK
jgi:hypothetical protein